MTEKDDLSILKKRQKTHRWQSTADGSSYEKNVLYTLYARIYKK
jgi:hypothetical protein